MEWLWACVSVIWTVCALAIARTGWAMGQRWEIQGFIDNGLGTRIDRTTNPTGFAVARWGMKFFAVVGGLFVLGGIAITIGWIVKAL